MKPAAMKSEPTLKIFINASASGAAIVAYLSIETFLVYAGVVWGSPELVFVASTAVFLAAFLWGGSLSARRLPRIAAGIVLSLPVAAVAVLPVSLVVSLNLSERASIVLFILAAALPSAAVFFLSRRFRYRRLNAEAEEWLSDRARYGTSAMLRRSHLRRWSLWMPSVSVLLLLFFWSPVQGFLSRPFHLRVGTMNHYTVHVPLSWTQFPNHYRDPGEIVELVRFRGMAKSAFTLGHSLAFFSSVTLISERDSSSKSEHVEYEKQLPGFRFHQLSPNPANLNCWEYRWSIWKYPDFWSAVCVNDDATFRAHFDGHVSDLDSFYEIVSSAEVRK